MWMDRWSLMNSFNDLPSSRQASSAWSSRDKPLRNIISRCLRPSLFEQPACESLKQIQLQSIYLDSVRLPALLPPSGCSNTSLKLCRKAANVGNTELSSLYTTVAHSNALPVSREHTNDIQLDPLEYSEGC